MERDVLIFNIIFHTFIYDLKLGTEIISLKQDSYEISVTVRFLQSIRANVRKNKTERKKAEKGKMREGEREGEEKQHQGQDKNYKFTLNISFNIYCL